MQILVVEQLEPESAPVVHLLLNLSCSHGSIYDYAIGVIDTTPVPPTANTLTLSAGTVIVTVVAVE